MWTQVRSAIIAFPRDKVRPCARREPGAVPAEVLIFTGVQVERLGEEAPPVPKLSAATRTER